MLRLSGSTIIKFFRLEDTFVALLLDITKCFGPASIAYESADWWLCLWLCLLLFELWRPLRAFTRLPGMAIASSRMPIWPRESSSAVRLPVADRLLRTVCGLLCWDNRLPVSDLRSSDLDPAIINIFSGLADDWLVNADVSKALMGPPGSPTWLMNWPVRAKSS